ncbi:hypothetical protein BVI434_1220004 [Burkholderia vietnamiensis]|nr:hypothetical protein BVI434_1220004 [Burkholderia vietnamiensis]
MAGPLGTFGPRERRRPRQAQGGRAVVRARLPRLRDRQLAKRAARERHPHAERARHLRADDGDDRARHRDARVADPRGRPAGADHRPDPLRVADRRRLRHHVGRAALAWLIRVHAAAHCAAPAGGTRGRGAVLCFASFSFVLFLSVFQPCSRSC